MASFCPGGSLHGCFLMRASFHGPAIGRSRLSVAGAALSLSARMVKAASTAPAVDALQIVMQLQKHSPLSAI